jgi:hypothetical protein
VRVRLSRFSAFVPVTLLLAGCGGGNGGVYREDDGVYADAEAEYEVGELPGDWDRLDVAGQNDLAFSRDDGAVIQVNASCDPALDIPLAALTAHLLNGFTGREDEERDTVPFAGREAMRTHVVASLDGVDRELLLYVLKKDECVYDLALIAPPGAVFADARPDFEALLAGFRTRRGGPAEPDR